MAERTNPHANLIIGAQDEASPVFDKIKASSQSMAAGVEQAATKAAGAVGGIGDKAAPAAQKLDGITASMIRQVQRLNAELEAGGARNAAYFEKMATIKGADAAALAPYLAQLKQAEAAQRVATTGLDQMGMSAKQTAAALRQVPMQFTDIVVSLQGGQSAMQVFLQQGGQLKDMFGGAGNAARALGGYVLGLVNPFTIAAAAVAGIAVAYKQGSAEADGYRMALVMTGNAAGTTAAQMQQMAGRISSVVGTQGAAAEALAQMAGSGRVAADNLQYFSEVAIKFERATGTAISETVKRFSDLADAPVDASRKLNEETNYLTAAIYEQIKALQDQGREADAAALEQEPQDVDHVVDRTDLQEGAVELAGLTFLGYVSAAQPARTARSTQLAIDNEFTQLHKLVLLNDVQRTSNLSRPKPALMLDNAVSSLIRGFQDGAVVVEGA